MSVWWLVAVAVVMAIWMLDWWVLIGIGAMILLAGLAGWFGPILPCALGRTC